MLREKDGRAALLLLSLPILLCAGLSLSGRTFFWNDLTYLNHPWRVLAAEALQSGEAPLWNPYNYMGMPLAAQQQNGVWYPASALFNLFPFAMALAAFIPAHLCLTALLAFLWLRREGLGRIAAAGGAALWAGSGIMTGHLQFMNHLSVLAYAPAFLLFRDRPWVLGLSLSLAFLAGYPVLIAVSAAAFLLSWLSGGRPLKAWGLAAGWALAAGALLLVPALQLAAGSGRGGGMPLQETLRHGMVPSDWRQWVGPLALGAGEFSPSFLWWKTCYIGLAGLAAAALGARRLRRKALLAGAAYLTVVLLLALGGSNPVSRWLWAHAAPLRLLRYPAHLVFLALPVLAYAAAVGLHRRRGRSILTVLIAAELSVYGLMAQPVMPRGFFGEAGPLVRRLQAELGPHRYLLSPRALHWTGGKGESPAAAMRDWKWRLYGLSNAPYHLEAVGSFGEPLVPRANYRHMDLLFGLGSLDASAAYLPWADAAIAMTRERLPSSRLRYAGLEQWHLYRTALRTSRAWWFPEKTGASLPPEAPVEGSSPWLRSGPAGRGGIPLSFTREGAGRFRVDGDTRAGWVYLAEPLQPGWRLWLNDRPWSAQPAMGPFQKLRAPSGLWILRGRYEPATWNAGLALSLAVLAASLWWWLRRLSAFAKK